jgi:hypothetical protein
LELIKDYELKIHYHLEKTNVVIDALSCKEHHNCLWVIPQGMLTNIALIPTIKEEVIVAQRTDVGMGHIQRRLKLGEVKCFHEDANGVLWFKNSLLVPKHFELYSKIMDEAKLL